jgi:hypothetical protein
LTSYIRGRKAALATRQTINRICARIDELAERISPPRRIFSVIVENHMNADAEIKAFAERVGTTNDDLIIAVAFVPMYFATLD